MFHLILPQLVWKNMDSVTPLIHSSQRLRLRCNHPRVGEEGCDDWHPTLFDSFNRMGLDISWIRKHTHIYIYKMHLPTYLPFNSITLHYITQHNITQHNIYSVYIYIYTRKHTLHTYTHIYIYTYAYVYVIMCARASQYANRKYRIGVRLCKYWYALQSLRFILNQLWVPLSGQRPIELHRPGSLTSYSVRACTAAEWRGTQLADLYAWVIQGEIQNMSIWVSDQIKNW